ncbi:hypothetical protein GCM10018966_045610 [Streptomyces yanii]
MDGTLVGVWVTVAREHSPTDADRPWKARLTAPGGEAFLLKGPSPRPGRARVQVSDRMADAESGRLIVDPHPETVNTRRDDEWNGAPSSPSPHAMIRDDRLAGGPEAQW